jgi:WD40 repeat protein
MRRLTAAALILLVFAVACTPTIPASTVEEVPTPMLTTQPAEEMSTPVPAEAQEQVLTSTPMPSATAVPATATALPTATATPTPVVFDRTGYSQFAVLRSFFPGYTDDLEERSRTVIRHALSPDGSRLAISGCWGSTDNFGRCESADSGLLVVLDTQNGEKVVEIPVGDSWPGGVAFTGDGKNLIYGTTGQKVALWDLSDNAPGITFFDQPQSARLSFPAVAAAPDGTSYAAVIEKMLYVWDSSGVLLLQTPASQVRTAYGALRYSADGSRLVVFAPDGTGVDVYRTEDWSLVRRFELASIIDAAISADGRVLAGIEMENGRGIVWDVETGEQLAELDPGFRVSFLQFNPAGDLLIVTGPGNLDTRDSYSSVGTVYETQSWTQIDSIYSFSSQGRLRSTRMAAAWRCLTVL